MKPTPDTARSRGACIAAPLFAMMYATLLGLLPAGCATTAPPRTAAASTVASAAPAPIWPEPPAKTRIRYLRSISGPQDWGIAKSLFRRLIDALTGSGSDHFIRPTGVAEQQGVLYVADPGAPALWIFDAGRNETHKVERVGDTELLSPVAVAIRPDGAVYLADSRLKKVFLIDRAGELIGVAAQQGLERPAGLAYDPVRGRLYVADSANQRIAVFGPDARLIGTWGAAGSGDGQFNYPTHLALDPAGTLLVTDALNFRVQAFAPDGRYLWQFGHHGDGSGDVAAPKGVAFDPAGHVFVVDALFDAVQIFRRDGRFLLGFGQHGAQPGQFWLPGGLFISPNNEIYVADAFNQRIQVFQGGPGAAREKLK